MRRVGIGLAVVVVAALVAVGIALRNAQALVERWKPEIERQASEQAGAPVTIGRIGAALLPSARVLVDDVAVGGATGVTLDRIALHARLWPLVRGRFEVDRLTLERPRVTVVRAREGWDVAGAPGARPAAERTVADTQTALAHHATLPAVLAVTVRRIQVRDGTVHYEDRTHGTAVDLAAVTADASVDASPTGVRMPRFTASATLDDGSALRVVGDGAELDAASGTATVRPVHVDVAGQRVALAATFAADTWAGDAHLWSDGVDVAPLAPLLARVAPTTKAFAPRGIVVPDLHAVLDGGRTREVKGTIGIRDVAATTTAGDVSGVTGRLVVGGTPEAPSVTAEELALRFRDAPATVRFAAGVEDGAAVLRELVVAAFGGTTRVGARVVLDSGEVTAEVAAAGLDAARLAGTFAPETPAQIAGTIARLEARLTARLGADVAGTTRGEGRVVVEHGRVLGVNLAAEVVKAVTALPVLNALVGDALPAEVRDLVGGKDTELSTLRTDFTLGPDAVRLANLAATSAAFTVDGGGRVGRDRHVDVQGTLRFTGGVSAMLGRRWKLLRTAFDGEGRLGVPFRVTGTPPRLVVTPDVDRLVAGVRGRPLVDDAAEVLRGLLDRRGKRLF